MAAGGAGRTRRSASTARVRRACASTGSSAATRVRVTDDVIWIAREGHHLELRTRYFSTGRDEVGSARLAAGADAGNGAARARRDGEAVQRGDLLMVLESMKMELAITAPHDGIVDGLSLRVGDKIARGQALLAVHGAARPGRRRERDE